MSAYSCRPTRAALGHTFDPDSGWCVHGCGVRDDGLVMNTRTGVVIAQPRTSADFTESRYR